MKSKLTLLGIPLLALLLGACASKTGWQTDYDAAFKQAKKQQKDVVLFFSRSDTDTMSQNLKLNIFDTESFIEASKERFVLINIDLPGSEENATLDEDQVKENNRIAQRYFLQSLPTVLLLTADGDVYGSVPYDESVSTTELYMEAIASFEPRRAERQEIKDRIVTATSNEDKARFIDELCEATEESYVPLLAPYFREIPELDPENALGLRSKYEFFIVNQDALDRYQAGDPSGAADIFVAASASPWLSPDEKVSAYSTAIGLYSAAGADSEEKLIDAIFGFAGLTPGAPDHRTVIESSSGIDKVTAIDTFIGAIDPNYQMFLGKYINEVLLLDPENTLGLRGKYELMNAYVVAQEFYEIEDMLGASGAFNSITESPHLSPAERFEAYQMAGVLLPFEAAEDALPIIALLEKALAADPQNENAMMLRYTLDQIRATAASMTPVTE
ncbi:MAG: thioredoxin family protein [Spirochaetaceae bacterium]|jgi:protein disulfide-isomerase|nr:thioredoxin family protein [Spirochaetaceae bacterium]